MKEKHMNKSCSRLLLAYLSTMSKQDTEIALFPTLEPLLFPIGDLWETLLFFNLSLCLCSHVWLSSELQHRSLIGQRRSPRVAPWVFISLHPQSGISCLTLVITLLLPLHTVTDMYVGVSCWWCVCVCAGGSGWHVCVCVCVSMCLCTCIKVCPCVFWVIASMWLQLLLSSLFLNYK